MTLSTTDVSEPAAPANLSLALRLFLHVGVHKTGTTSIQRRLHRHGAELRAKGFLYPEGRFPRQPTQHSVLAALATRAARGELTRTLTDIRAEALAGDCHTVILSGERLSTLARHRVELLRASLIEAGFDPTVVVFFRTEIDHLRSVVNHWMRAPAYQTPSRIAKALKVVDADAVEARFTAAFGADRVIRHDLSGSDDAVAIFDADLGLELEVDDIRRNARMDFATLSWANAAKAELGLSRKDLEDAYRDCFGGRSLPVAAEAMFLSDVAAAIGGATGRLLQSQLDRSTLKEAPCTTRIENAAYLRSLARYAEALARRVEGRPARSPLRRLLHRLRKGA